MKVDKIPDYNFSRSTNQPVFTALKIREPQLWEKEVLDSFVKDKEVQKIVKSFENIGIDLSAARGDKKFPITSDNIFLSNDSNRVVISNITVGKDNKSFGYGTVSTNIKQYDEPKPLIANKFFNYLLKKHDTAFDQHVPESPIHKWVQKIIDINKSAA